MSVMWENEICILGNGWDSFVKEIELECGDTLVLFNSNCSTEIFVNACIFKKEDMIVNLQKDKMQTTNSFFKVVSETSLEEGMLVVPKCIKDTYGEMLSGMKEVEVCGERRFLFFSIIGGYLANIGKILEVFHVIPTETIIFTIGNNNILKARAYQEDGKEIEYSKRLNVLMKNESEEENGKGDHEDTSQNLVLGIESDKMNVDAVFFPQFIIVVKEIHYERAKIKIPEFIMDYGYAIPSNLALQFPNGSVKYVQYDHLDSSFVNMNGFMKEIKRCCARIIVFRYKVSEVFAVNAFSDDGTEVDYSPMRARGPLYSRGTPNNQLFC
ncbi:hypothetical protein POM88_037975 [Heracleum sosnowskyi]|uniref:TF-B3 domain-containing protein n=1 Tax=Heracleum sosnowskyi TaxID=360622 RepID=A0AAD8MH94_9APIA|nr:hypothetical protein POM88_037975 [Heracleum sosnowskyi]